MLCYRTVTMHQDLASFRHLFLPLGHDDFYLFLYSHSLRMGSQGYLFRIFEHHLHIYYQIHWPGPGWKVTGYFLRLISKELWIFSPPGVVNLESIMPIVIHKIPNILHINTFILSFKGGRHRVGSWSRYFFDLF